MYSGTDEKLILLNEKRRQREWKTFPKNRWYLIWDFKDEKEFSSKGYLMQSFVSSEEHKVVYPWIGCFQTQQLHQKSPELLIQMQIPKPSTTLNWIKVHGERPGYLDS